MKLCRLKFSKDSIFGLLYVFMVVPTFWAGTAPDSTLSTEDIRKTMSYIGYVIFVITILFAGFNSNRILVFDRKFLLGVFGVLAYWCFFYFSAINDVPPGLLNIGFLILFLAVSHEIKYKIYNYIKKLLVCTSVLGIAFYILTVMMIDIGQSIYPYYSSETAGSFYIVWGPLNIFTEGLFVRLCGFFNEPGFWGTVLALILTVERCKINRTNIILFVSGVCSWSLAFFLIMAFNILYRYHSNILKIALAIIIVFASTGIFLADNPNAEQIINRMSFDSHGNWVGDNRSDENITNGLIDTVTSEYILFGHGTGYTATLTNKAFATYKSLIIEYGILGVLLMYGAIFFLAVKEAEGKIDVMWLIFMFLLSLYQRPNIFLSVYFIILYGGIQRIVKKQ